MKDSNLRIALAQISPVWLNRRRTLEKAMDTMQTARRDGAELIVFGESFCPGYPFWLAYTEGASWELPINKDFHAHYMEQAVCLERGDLDQLCRLAKDLSMSVYLGIVERPEDRAGHSLYCSLVYLDSAGNIRSVHRKLQPTYDERLVWSPGDGNGLVANRIGAFGLGGLNCWENWMPLARAALYAQGVNVHIAVWPGSDYNTKDITRFIARESRSYVVSVSSVLQDVDLPGDIPHYDELLKRGPKVYANGGSCVAAPDGTWLLEPQLSGEGIHTVDVSQEVIYRERQNFDPSGHYSRPDVTQLLLNTERQGILHRNPTD
jgi:nitrilase